ncbi:hypothetical protein [Spiroplasma cantharicola]|uniref:Uncharacterized protein n=1 Tax=Spiroplasma cantharicola TaxID=362837 RepID=A0A0M5KC38_9MOLU|nr:hypothetical protein [Spiroplasma cantharicola]ALD65989.1 hypothetical protein SCANT_v1c00790 [Spiroplasma cantharicola]
MREEAYIFSIVSTVLSSFLLIPLAWMIPMTIATKKSIGDNKPHIALGICSIFFMGILGFICGILILIPEEN